MSSVALTTAGSIIAAIPGPWQPVGFGLIVAGITIGSYVDQQYLFPLLFEEEHGDKKGFETITLTPGQEGSSLPYCLGPNCRIPGVVIWMSDPRNSPSTSDGLPVMGKGGGGQRPQTDPAIRWYADVRLALNYSHEDPIVNLVRVLGNGRTLYELYHTISQTGSVWVEYVSYGYWCYINEYPPLDGLYLHAYKYTTANVSDMTVSGFPEPTYAQNNGDKSVISSEHIKAGSQWLGVAGTLTAGGSYTNQIPDITFEQTITGYFSKYMTGYTLYTGAMDQDADESNDILDDYWGGTGSTGQWPAYRGVANVSIRGLYLTQFANQMPKFDAVVKAHPDGYTYAAAIQKICEDANVSAGNIDVSGIDATQYLEGAVFYGPRKAKTWLQNIMLAGNILYQRDGYKLKFFSRKNIDEVTIDADDIGVIEIDSKTVSEAEVTNLQHLEWPGGVVVEYLDLHKNMEPASFEYNADDEYYAFNKQNTLKYTFSIAMSRAEAESIAMRQLWLARSGKQYCKIQVPYKYCHILENDAVSFTKFGKTWRFVVQRRERTTRGLIVLEGPVSPASLDEWPWEDDEQVELVGGKGPGPGLVAGEILDFAPFQDAHVNNPGFYAVACGEYGAVDYFGCELWESDDDVDYTKLMSLPDQGGVCDCNTTLGGGVEAAYWDEVNTLQITTKNRGVFLESVTKLECQNGMNRIAVKTSTGWEVIGFADVQVDTTTDYFKKYTISTLLRGLCNTEHLIDSHGADETAVILTCPGLHHIPQNTQRKGRTKYFKFVPFGFDEADYSGVSHNLNLGTVTPFQPCHITGARDGSDNLTIGWDWRTRSLSRMFALATPKDDFMEYYEIDIMDGATVVRSIYHEDISGLREHVYSAANQTTDGLTPGDPVKVRVYQFSPIVGRGRYLEETV